MESLMSILFIPAFLLLCFVVVWFLRFWIGAFVPDDETMSIPKKTMYTIFGILFFILSSPVTFTNIAILLCSCVVIILVMKYITPVFYTKAILFIKKYSNDIIAFMLFIIFCIDKCYHKWENTIITNLEVKSWNL